MGLALTRNPGLYRAVAAEVGIFDLLRFELTANGAYNTPEFGTVGERSGAIRVDAQAIALP